jgi:hypothetical protein
MIDKQKILESIAGLTEQKETLKQQLFQVEGAILLCNQLIAEEGAQAPSQPKESSDDSQSTSNL